MTEAEGMVILGFVSLAAAGDAHALDQIVAFVEQRTERSRETGATARQRRWRAKQAVKASTPETPNRLPDPSTPASTNHLQEPSTPPSVSVLSSALSLAPNSAAHKSKSGEKESETETQNAREETPVVDARVDGASRRSVDVQRVYEHWIAVMGKNPATTKLTAGRRSKIEARLRDGYSVADLCAAVDGCKRSPFHMGDNDRHEPYNGLETVLRDAKTVESHRDRGGPAVPFEPRRLIPLVDPKALELPPADEQVTREGLAMLAASIGRRIQP